MSIYYQIFDIFQRFIYGAEAALTSDQTLTLTLLSTVVCVGVAVLPFIVALKVVQLFLGR